MQMGKNKSVTAFYDDCVIAHLSRQPFVVTLLGSTTLNVGLFDTFSNEVFAALDALRMAASGAEELP